MAKKPKKYLKSDYSPRKKSLPKALEFLDGFNFHAIIEDTSGANIKRLIEVKPVSLRRLIERVKYLSDCLESEAETVEELEQDNKSKEASAKLSIKKLEENIAAVVIENRRLKNEMEKISEENARLESNNEILMERCAHLPDEKYKKSLKSHLNVMQDSEFKAVSNKPMQGGLVRGK